MPTKHYKSTDKTSGESVSFDWDGAKPPSDDDVQKIFDQQRDKRIADAQSKGTQMPPTSFLGGLLNSGVHALGLDEPWRPAQGLQDIGEGMRKVIQGQHAYEPTSILGTPQTPVGPQPQGEQYPRLGGLVQAARGLMGVAGPVGTVVAGAAAPEAVIPGVMAGNLASRGIESVLPEDMSPEIKGAITTGAGLAAGIGAGHAGSTIAARFRPVPPVATVPSVKPTNVELAPRPLRNWNRTPPDVSPYSVTNEGPPKLEAGPPIQPSPAPVAPTAPPSGPSPQELPPAIPNVQPVMPRSPLLPSAGLQKQLPEVSPIEMTQAPIRMPQAGTYQATQAGLPNVEALPGPSINQLRLPAPEAQPDVPSAPSVEAGQEAVPPQRGTPPVAPPPEPPQPQAPPVAPFENTMLPKPIRGSSSMSPSLRNVEPFGPRPLRSPGEQMPEAIPPEKVEQAPISPQRTERIGQLQSMLEDANKDGDTSQAELFKQHLDTENQLAEIERSGTPEQKQKLAEVDQMTSRVKELEDQDDAGQLKPEGIQELRQLYQKINAADIEHFFSSEEGASPSTGGRPGDISRRPFLSRLWFTTKNVVPLPGDATIRDVRGWSSQIASPNRVLADSGIPGAREIGEGTPAVEVEKNKWLGTNLRAARDIVKNLSDVQLRQLSQVMETNQVPADPVLQQASFALRRHLDKVFQQLPQGTGYTQGYLPRLKASFQGDDWFHNAVNDAMSTHLGPLQATAQLFERKPVESMSGSETPLAQKGVGIAEPSILKTRTGKEGAYETDLRKIIPMYHRLAAKAIFDMPWIEEARQHLARIPDDAPVAKSLATDYLRNYADTPDGYEGVRGKWNQFTSSLMRAHARAVLGLSTRLMTLHGSRFMANIYPELGNKYSAIGIAKTIANPIDTYQDLGRRGVLPQNITPWMFKTYGEKLDSVLAEGSLGDAMPDAFGWHGFNQKYLDEGHDSVTAGNMATDKIMDLSMRSTPARMQRMFDTNGPLRFALQYKQQIMKIAEQYAVQIPKAVAGSVTGDQKAENAGKILRYIIGAGSMYALKQYATTWHLNPLTLSEMGAGGVLGTLKRVIGYASAGHYDKALGEAGLMFVPGQKEIRSVLSGKGPTAFQTEH